MSAIRFPWQKRPAMTGVLVFGALGTLGAFRVGLTSHWRNNASQSPDLDVLFSGENDQLDIVFVHGINPLGSSKHARDTWTAKVRGGKVFWPKDLLPKSLPNSRVLLLQYNSSISWNTGLAKLTDHANNLMQLLKTYRKESSDRPIVFICHSLGGLVVKQALLLPNHDFKEIIDSTRCLVFFGTPHRGATGAIADIGIICADIVRAIQGEGRNELPKLLENESPLADALTRAFEDKVKDFRILSIYETRSMMGPGLIVGRASAVLGLPQGESTLDLDRNHSTMCKFTGMDDSAYKSFMKSLQFEIQLMKENEEELRMNQRQKQLQVSPPEDENEFIAKAERIAHWCTSHEKYGESAELYESILQRCDNNSNLGRNCPSAVNAAYNRGHALMSMKKYSDAIQMYDRAVEGRLHLAGRPDHPQVLDARRLRGEVLQRWGKFDKSEKEFKDILKTLEGCDENEPGVKKGLIDTRANLAFLHQMREQWIEAAELLRPLLDYAEMAGQDTFIIQQRLAYVLKRAGKYDDSEAQYRDLVMKEKQKHKIPGISLLKVMEGFGDVLKRRGKLQEAEEQYAEVLSGLSRLRSAGRVKIEDITRVNGELEQIRRERDERKDFQ